MARQASVTPGLLTVIISKGGTGGVSYDDTTQVIWARKNTCKFLLLCTAGLSVHKDGDLYVASQETDSVVLIPAPLLARRLQ
jgi:hypothetical protein